MGLFSALNGEPYPANEMLTPIDYIAALHRALLHPANSLATSSPGAFVSVVAVVVAFEKPAKSQGSDFVMRIRVMDPTMSPSDPPVALTVFKPRIEDMPSVQAAGDIVYFDSVKVTLFGGRAQLISNNMSRWDVLHTGVLGSAEQQCHPVVAYLERWWKKQSERLVGAADGGRSPAKTWVAPGPKHVNGSDKYLRKVSELQGASFADMYLEVVRVGGAGNGASSSVEMQSIDAVHKQPTQRIQCLVTDYTTNPLINTDDPEAMDGRFVWLTICEPQTINKLPAIEPDAVYWLRSVRIEYSDTHGMSLRLMPNAMYPKTISVVRVDPEDDHVLPLLARKAEYQKEMQRCRDATIAAAGDPDEPEEEAEPGPLVGSAMYGDGGRQLMVLGEPVFAKVTSIAEIMDSEKIDSCVYRVKAFVVGVHPPEPERAFVLVCDMCGNTHEHMPAAPLQCNKCNAPWALEFRMLLRLKDEEDGEEARECVAVCQGIGEGNLDHESTWLLHDEAARNNFVEAIAPIWRAVHPAFGGKPGAMEAELLVASVVAPGAGGGSIGRTLLVSGGLGAIFFADIL